VPDIDAVVFDFYGTLGVSTRAEGIEVVLERFGYTWDASLSRHWSIDRLNGLAHAKASRSAADYRAWRWRRRRRYLEKLGVDASDMHEVLRAIGDWESEAAMSIFDDVRGVTGWLDTAGIKLGICSNWDWDLDGLLRQAGVDHLFDSIIWSARAGARKPHRRIYASALRDLDVAGDQALFVGDSWLADVVGPARFGIRSVHLNRSGEPCSETEEHMCIRSLLELQPIIARATTSTWEEIDAG
jgi:putative hydrolase of the HAD superfamily